MRSACLPRHPAVAYLFLVRPMRLPIASYVAPVALFGLASCVMIGDIPVTGRARDVSKADIRAAIVADVTSRGQPVEIQVIDHNEIHLYYIRRYGNEEVGHIIIKRIRGKWRYAGGVIVTS